ncbi:Pre-mRNA-splicing factor 18 [Pleurostoma richardsiae]|uniref:Pre-mRNA-splicing factor 18 n=1 Tax=Pleurostoma richardsiae TaxID=41990 RepID=A0AA38VMR7_9PEZI|nr:Pre-mRNA-splicing factor 18 [Pleurostoma richardsiae]
MDFAALLSKEIAKAKGSTPPAAAAADSSASSSTTKKYIRKGDAEAARREAYLAEQKRLEEERAARAAAKRKREEDAEAEARAREEKRQRLAEESRRRREEREAEEERARRRRLGLPEVPPSREGSAAAASENDEDDDEAEDIPDGELTEKLRALGEPATLFGEGHAARRRRYRRLTTAVTQGPIPTTLAPVEEKDMKVDAKVPKDKAGRKWLFRQLASYFNMILREWEEALEKERRDTMASRQAYNAMVQSKDAMRPLFRKFEKGDLDESILEPVVEIVKAAQERRYVDANDGYLRLSIGKAAWPIGVTMVGIHERSAREKLHNGERGHVMGDEVTRKYLQSIKRCLTFAQVRWPPEDVRQLMG